MRIAQLEVAGGQDYSNVILVVVLREKNMSPKIKTMYCKVASIIGPPHTNQKNLSVADIVRECHEMDVLQRRVPINMLKEYLSSHSCIEQDNGLLIHLVKATEGSDTSIVPTPRPSQKNVELDTLSAPKDADYLENECFAYFFNNYVITLSNGISNAWLGNYLTTLAREKSFIGEKQEIRLSNIANKDALKKIREHGITSMTVSARLNTPTWAASTPEASDIKKAVKSIFKKDAQTDRAAIENYHYSLTITGNGKVGTECIDPLTEEGAALFDELEGQEATDTKLKITLKNEEEMDLKGTTLSRNIRVERKAASLDKQRILAEAIAYKKELIEEASIDG